ncbi:MAG: dipeptide ABC transporter ATP-binding protein [Hyphomicrobiaceae bacterium]|nr:MAG: dipeptide ABC transporter ATP-binding protein [Hyphomicrobiaceae bacterium]
MSALLSVENLVKHFSVRDGVLGRASGLVKAVDGVSFTLEAGETFAIVGESGCGKSTVARLILRLIEPTAGRVLFRESDVLAVPAAELRRIRRHIQIVFQDPYGSLNPRLTVGQMLMEPLALHSIVPAAARQARVRELLDLVGLPATSAFRYPHEFSGGQRQRIAIARALAVEPSIILCDEPVSALDVSIQAQILNLLQDLQRRLSIALIFISHNLAVVRHVAERIGVMYLGRMVEVGTAQAIFSNPRHPYTAALLSSVPVPVPGARLRTDVLGGDVPSPLKPPSGCHFHTRCPFVSERCRSEAPLPRELAAAHAVACHRADEIDLAPSARPVHHVASASLIKLQAAFQRQSNR